VPTAIDGAAMIDGRSRLRTLVSVILPSIRPGIASAAVLGVVTTWSQFAVPFILIDSRELFPVSVGVVNLQQTAGEITTQYLAASAILAVAPAGLLFMVLQAELLPVAQGRRWRCRRRCGLPTRRWPTARPTLDFKHA
jgi:multiple sugar transport system permease protein